jgi:hypothetical protein
VSCWACSGDSSFFAEPRRKDENERPQTIQRQQISKMASPTTSPARPDARVQHVGLQFGKGSGEHLRFASAARECLVMKRTTLSAFFPSHGGGRETSLGYACWLYRAKKDSLSQAARAASNLRCEPAARIARRFANFGAKAIAPFDKI